MNETKRVLANNPEICQRCGDIQPDHRKLFMSAGYEMNELGIPFKKVESSYILTVCKFCRSDWMKAIKNWFENPISEPSCGSGIFIKEFGATREISDEEFQKRHPGKTPYRMPTAR